VASGAFNMKIKSISVARDFSPFPAGRFMEDGPFNGEKFRKEILLPALKENERVEIEIDDVSGYGSSFLEEAFGGLVRVEGFKPDEVLNKIQINFDNTSFEIYKEEIIDYIKSANNE
jgi:hypothetical protein